MATTHNPTNGEQREEEKRPNKLYIFIAFHLNLALLCTLKVDLFRFTLPLHLDFKCG
jgi:hypothetical protein